MVSENLLKMQNKNLVVYTGTDMIDVLLLSQMIDHRINRVSHLCENID